MVDTFELTNPEEFSFISEAITSFIYRGNNIQIYESSRNSGKKKDQQQFRYRPLLLPELKNEKDLKMDISDDLLITFFIELDSPAARKLAYDSLRKIEGYENISESNVFALQVSKLKANLKLFTDKPKYTLPEPFDFSAPTNSVAINIQCDDKESMEMVKQKLPRADIEIEYSIHNSKTVINNYSIKYNAGRLSNLINKLNQYTDQGEKYIDKFELADIVSGFIVKFTLTGTIENETQELFQKDLVSVFIEKYLIEPSDKNEIDENDMIGRNELNDVINEYQDNKYSLEKKDQETDNASESRKSQESNTKGGASFLGINANAEHSQSSEESKSTKASSKDSEHIESEVQRQAKGKMTVNKDGRIAKIKKDIKEKSVELDTSMKYVQSSSLVKNLHNRQLSVFFNELKKYQQEQLNLLNAATIPIMKVADLLSSKDLHLLPGKSD